MNKLEPKEPQQTGIEFKRDQDFLNRYANNVQLDASTWDLKIVFGQTDPFLGSNVVVQHTAITLPWNYVKLLSYLLQANVAAREAEDGHIPVPPKIIPAPPAELPAEVVGRLKFPEEGIKAVHKVWDEFVAANPEING